jgi:hypothetical protein
MLSNSVTEKLLLARLNNQQSSGYIARQLSPGIGARFAQSAASKTVHPESGAAVSAKVPIGQPIAPTAIPHGLPPEESVTVNIDMTGQGNTTAKERIILFDEGKFHQYRNGIATPYPAGTVYIESAANNLYDPWVSGLCGNTYVFSGVLMSVSAAAGAQATPEMQFQEAIKAYYHSTREQTMSILPVEVYNDPQNYDRNMRVIVLTDRKARVDRQTAWDFSVFHGLKVTLTFFNVAYARD